MRPTPTLMHPCWVTWRRFWFWPLWGLGAHTTLMYPCWPHQGGGPPWCAPPLHWCIFAGCIKLAQERLWTIQIPTVYIIWGATHSPLNGTIVLTVRTRNEWFAHYRKSLNTQCFSKVWFCFPKKHFLQKMSLLNLIKVTFYIIPHDQIWCITFENDV